MYIQTKRRVVCRYDAPVKIQLPFNIIGLVAFELFAMHYVETKRGLDLRKPGSQVEPSQSYLFLTPQCG